MSLIGGCSISLYLSHKDQFNEQHNHHITTSYDYDGGDEVRDDITSKGPRGIFLHTQLVSFVTYSSLSHVMVHLTTMNLVNFKQ